MDYNLSNNSSRIEKLNKFIFYIELQKISFQPKDFGKNVKENQILLQF